MATQIHQAKEGRKEFFKGITYDNVNVIIEFLGVQSTQVFLTINRDLHRCPRARLASVRLLGESPCALPFVYSTEFFKEIRRFSSILQHSHCFREHRVKYRSFLATIVNLPSTPTIITRLFFSILSDRSISHVMETALVMLAKFFNKTVAGKKVVNKQLIALLQSNLAFASSWGLNELIQLFVKCGADIKASNKVKIMGRHYSYDPMTFSVLRMKVCNPNRDPAKTVGLLKDLGASLNKCSNPKKETPLYWAAYDGNTSLCSYLLQQKANVNIRTRRLSTPLHSAVSQQHKETIDFLLQQSNIEVNAQTTLGLTPLMNACSQGNLAIVQSLLKANADTTKATVDNMSALHFLTMSDTSKETALEIFHLLLDHKCPIDEGDHERTTPLMRCAESHPELIEPLVSAGASLTKSDIYGNTPLHHCEHSESIMFLMSHQANFNVLNRRGFTPLEYMKFMGCDDAAQTLSDLIAYNNK